MSRLSSNRKIQNMDTQTIKLLQDILKYCQEHGHKPDHNIAYHKTLSNINHLIYTRQQKGIAIPKDIPALYAEIKQFPTAAKHRLNLQKATKKLKQESKYDKIQRLTPYDLRIMKQILGDQTFTCFINTDIDIIATKNDESRENQHFSTPRVGDSICTNGSHCMGMGLPAHQTWLP